MLKLIEEHRRLKQEVEDFYTYIINREVSVGFKVEDVNNYLGRRGVYNLYFNTTAGEEAVSEDFVLHNLSYFKKKKWLSKGIVRDWLKGIDDSVNFSVGVTLKYVAMFNVWGRYTLYQKYVKYFKKEELLCRYLYIIEDYLFKKYEVSTNTKMEWLREDGKPYFEEVEEDSTKGLNSAKKLYVNVYDLLWKIKGLKKTDQKVLLKLIEGLQLSYIEATCSVEVLLGSGETEGVGLYIEELYNELYKIVSDSLSKLIIVEDSPKDALSLATKEVQNLENNLNKGKGLYKEFCSKVYK